MLLNVKNGTEITRLQHLNSIRFTIYSNSSGFYWQITSVLFKGTSFVFLSLNMLFSLGVILNGFNIVFYSLSANKNLICDAYQLTATYTCLESLSSCSLILGNLHMSTVWRETSKTAEWSSFILGMFSL